MRISKQWNAIHWKRELWWCQLCRHWRHWRLSLWQPPFPPVTTKLTFWQLSVFRVYPEMPQFREISVLFLITPLIKNIATGLLFVATHWKAKIVIVITLFSLAVPNVVTLTISGAANAENVGNLATFAFKWRTLTENTSNYNCYRTCMLTAQHRYQSENRC